MNHFESFSESFIQFDSFTFNFVFTVEDRKRPLKRFTPPRKLGDGSETESGSEYSDDDYSESSYT